MSKHAKKRSVRLAAVAIAVLAGAALNLVTHQASATEVPTGGGQQDIREPRFELPPGAPAPGPGFRILSAYYVEFGVQTYSCTADGVFSTASVPSAFLRQYGGRGIIKHREGPSWVARDGSTLVGAVVQRVDQKFTIPWLLLSTTPEGPQGELSLVTHISRVNTRGGLRPTEQCTPGETRDVRYGADYVFWIPTRAG